MLTAHVLPVLVNPVVGTDPDVPGSPAGRKWPMSSPDHRATAEGGTGVVVSNVPVVVGRLQPQPWVAPPCSGSGQKDRSM